METSTTVTSTDYLTYTSATNTVMSSSPATITPLSSLGKPRLLEEAILMKNKLDQRNSFEPLLSAILDKFIDTTAHIRNIESTISELRISNNQLRNKVKYLGSRNKELSYRCDELCSRSNILY